MSAYRRCPYREGRGDSRRWWGTEHYSVRTRVGAGRLFSEVKVVEVEELGR